MCYFSAVKSCTSSSFFFSLVHPLEFFSCPFEEWSKVSSKVSDEISIPFDKFSLAEFDFEKFSSSEEVLFHFFFHFCLLFFKLFLFFSRCFDAFLIGQFLPPQIFQFFLFFLF